ncbi:MAG TPA: MMPL family transporter, partial [Gemmatimonadaceae bacterium]|nr:MMPL family transporter [Gemmatimonadaceae bacterium]
MAHALIRHRRRVALLWLIAAAVLLPQARHVEARLDVAARVDGSESAAVEGMLAERFGSPFARYAVLVLSGVPGPDGDDGRRVLESAAATVGAVPGVARTFSYLDAPDPMFVGGAGGGALPGTFLVAGLDPSTGSGRAARAAGARAPDALVPALRAATARLADSLRASYPRSALAWTGEIPLNVDLRRTSAADAQGAERRVLPLTLALLLLAFGALGAALLPVAAGGFAIALTMGAAAVAATRWPLSILLQNVVSMLGLGLGIDYALLMVSRFREARSRGLDADAAAAEAARTAGHTILLSGAAVAVGFAGLLAVPLSEMRSVAAGGLIVVTVSVLLATTLLPGVLAWLGPRVDAGRLPRRRAPAPSSGGAGWRRWGRRVAARPGLVLALAAPPLLALAAQARRLETRLPRGDWLPPAMESARGLRALREMGRSGVVQAVRVVL